MTKQKRTSKKMRIHFKLFLWTKKLNKTVETADSIGLKSTRVKENL